MPRLPLRLISIVAFLLLWAGLAALADSNEVPGPLAVLGFLVREAAAGELVYHLAATLARVAAAFTIAMDVGPAVGVLMGQHSRLDRSDERRVGRGWVSTVRYGGSRYH